MARRPPVRLPEQWPDHVKSGILHAISLANVVLAFTRGQAASEHRMRAQLDQARTEIALLREELQIKDGRWKRARTRRRPHYAPTQRMRILQLRAARGWTLEKAASVFLLDLHTLQLWIRRLDEHGERDLIQTAQPVNRFPEFVRHLVRELKRLFPSMGNERIARFCAQAGLVLSASTVGRIVREPFEPPSRDEPETVKMRRRAVARRPGDVWHVDLTAVPIQAGFWVPWRPFALPPRWPFCWWVAVVVDQMSRSLVGFAVFRKLPTSEQMQAVLDRAIRKQGFAPRCIVTDKGSQFKCRSYRRWCKRRKIRARFGHLGEPGSIAIAERFIRSMKQECFRLLPFVPMRAHAVRRELRCFAVWYNEHRPHTTLGDQTPADVMAGRPRQVPRVEARPRWRCGSRGRVARGSLKLDVSYVEGRRHLPVIALRRAA